VADGLHLPVERIGPIDPGQLQPHLQGEEIENLAIDILGLRRASARVLIQLSSRRRTMVGKGVSLENPWFHAAISGVRRDRPQSGIAQESGGSRVSPVPRSPDQQRRRLPMDYRVTGLSAEAFQHLFGLTDEQLASRGVRRYVVDQCPGYPDRIEMRDAEPGATVLLLNHVCQPADTPYRASHAIFVREGAVQTFDAINQVPDVMRIRLLSLRGYSREGMMLDADVVDGRETEAAILQLFANHDVCYIHAHNAKQGCYSGRIDRA
jgi:hypothetical protein